MSETLMLHDMRVLICSPEGAKVQSDRDALDLIGEAMGHDAECVVVPAERFGKEFFQLKTRIAGEISQKFVNYRLRLVVLGDISSYVERSDALRDFVIECNRGTQLWFITELDELEAHIDRARRRGQ